MIRFHNVSKCYPGGTIAVRELTLTVNKGETLILLGTSGCGKTTTLKMINRLIEPTSGTIEVDGYNILEQNPVILRRSIGYVFQQIGPVSYTHLTLPTNREV